ncbi:hypothetical protein OAB57_03450, partial [Bacteriovoracaceae bacterium]|nr:hypothetical protein [Bacteriovoracaceae bacterium]
MNDFKQIFMILVLGIVHLNTANGGGTFSSCKKNIGAIEILLSDVGCITGKLGDEIGHGQNGTVYWNPGSKFVTKKVCFDKGKDNNALTNFKKGIVNLRSIYLKSPKNARNHHVSLPIKILKTSENEDHSKVCVLFKMRYEGSESLSQIIPKNFCDSSEGNTNFKSHEERISVIDEVNNFTGQMIKAIQFFKEYKIVNGDFDFDNFVVKG